MILINLLPHREAARKRQRELFFAQVGGAALVGGLVVGLIFTWFQSQISTQQTRNAYLGTEIAKLDVQIKDIATLQQELEIVHNYIALCSIQFEQRLQYLEHIDSNCHSILVPKLLLQLCVENAVKHGISKLASGGEVTISARLAGPEVVLQVSNHGSLTEAGDKHSAVGLNNIRQRLQLLYQAKASLQLYQRGQKVITEIRLPLET